MIFVDYECHQMYLSTMKREVNEEQHNIFRVSVTQLKSHYECWIAAKKNRSDQTVEAGWERKSCFVCNKIMLN